MGRRWGRDVTARIDLDIGNRAAMTGEALMCGGVTRHELATGTGHNNKTENGTISVA